MAVHRLARFTLTERAAIARHVREHEPRRPDLDDGDGHDVVSRTEFSFAPRAGVAIEGGTEARRSSASAREQVFTGGRFQLRESYNASAITASAFPR